jgi:UDP-N-acetylglucosamine 2-epimerase (non-hydrolysing)
VQVPVIFPAHPRTLKRMAENEIDPGRVRMIDALGYLDFLCLMGSARVVLTDSGGIQEETTVLGVPCLTIRENTERPVTVTEGTNQLIGTDPEKILEAALAQFTKTKSSPQRPELWDGHAAGRIIDVLERRLTVSVRGTRLEERQQTPAE